jgi:hypothetical protein
MIRVCWRGPCPRPLSSFGDETVSDRRGVDAGCSLSCAAKDS